MKKMMKGPDFERWRDKNIRENTGYEIKIGDRITDRWSCSGVVTLIDKWDEDGEEPSVENHGAINAMMDDGNEEHYVWFRWQENFRVVRA